MLAQLLHRNLERRSDQPALICAGVELSHAQLARRVQGFARQLRDLGVGADDCVAISLLNCPELPIALFACAQRRASALLLDPVLHVDPLGELLLGKAPRVVITDREGSSDLARVCRGLFPARSQPALIEIGSVAAAFSSEDDSLDLVDDAADACALYFCTSGSTGAPKLVARSQAQLCAEASNFVSTAGLSSDDRFLCVLPLHHSFGLEMCLLGAIAAGSTLVLLPAYDAAGARVRSPFVARCREVAELVQRHAIRVLPAVPQQFLELARLPPDAAVDLSSLKLCIASGCALPAPVFEQFKQRHGLLIRQSYGSSEVGTATLNLDPAEHFVPESVGRPVHNVAIVVVDDDGQVCPVRKTGRILIQSAVAGSVGDAWFESGDLGHIDGEERLHVTGRLSAFIHTAGYRVDPRLVEAVLLRHPAVRDAAVLAVNVADIGDVVGAALVSDGSCGAEAIVAFCSELLASFEVPRRVYFLPELPRGALGKIQEGELRETLLTQAVVAGAGPAAPDASAARGELRDELLATAGDREALLLDRLQRQIAGLLKVEAPAVDVDGRLQDLGFDSLRATEFRAWLDRALALAIPITAVWNSPTLRVLGEALLAMLNSAHEPPAQSGAPAGPAGERRADGPSEGGVALLERLADAEIYRALREGRVPTRPEQEQP